MTNRTVQPTPDDYRDALAWIAARARDDNDAIQVIAYNANIAHMTLAITDLIVFGIQANGNSVDDWCDEARRRLNNGDNQ